MLKWAGIVNSVIILGAVNLTGTICTSEDFSIGADVKLANETFKEELQKMATNILERESVVETEEGFVEDSTVLGYLMYIRYKLNAMDNQVKKKYKDNFCAYYKFLEEFLVDHIKKFDDEVVLVDNLFIKNSLDILFFGWPDILLNKDFFPIQNSAAEEDFLFLIRQFFQKTNKHELIEGRFGGSIEEEIIAEWIYYGKKPKKRLEGIGKILAQYGECFKGPQKKFMEKAKKWGPKTRDESLLAREIMYSLFQMVQNDNKDLKFPFNNAKKQRRSSRFDFAT